MNTFKDKITTFYDIPNLNCYLKEVIEKVFCNFIFFTIIFRSNELTAIVL